MKSISKWWQGKEDNGSQGKQTAARHSSAFPMTVIIIVLNMIIMIIMIIIIIGEQRR